MLAIIILIVLLAVQVALCAYSLITKSSQKKFKYIVAFIELALFIVLSLCKVIDLSFRWYMLIIILLVQAILGAVFFIAKRKKEKPFSALKTVFACAGTCVVFTMAVVPAFIFPQYQQPQPTGQYAIETASYTLTDTSRKDQLSPDGGNRKVTVQFWYPELKNNEQQRFPLVIFSHGAFGFRGSNYSTFANLASNGFVVCSIDHTYHSFFTKQTDGKTVIVNPQFLNNVLTVQNGQCDDKTSYELSQEWLKTRKSDMNFVLDTVLKNAKEINSGEAYRLINTDEIGLMGHSLGGATAAAIGRERPEIDAVVVLDGTMFGELTDFVNGREVLNTTPYPVPILDIFNEEHYKEALANADVYANMVADANALDSRQIMFKGAGHLNFTDLPLFSPALARQLGTGSIDSRYCIETINRVVLEYFNSYLKGKGTLNLLKEY